MLNARSFFRYWLPVLVWMAVIFSASTDRLSFQHSSRMVAPLVHWLWPHISAEALHNIVLAVRKCGHLTEYAILALLLWRAWRRSPGSESPPWRWSQAALVLVVVALYAASDEFHQAFVPSREGSLWDVSLDTCGAALALVCLWGIGRLRKRRA